MTTICQAHRRFWEYLREQFKIPLTSRNSHSTGGGNGKQINMKKHVLEDHKFMEKNKTGIKDTEFPNWEMEWGCVISSRKFKESLTAKVAFMPHLKELRVNLCMAFKRSLQLLNDLI